MKLRKHRHLLAGLILVAGASILLTGCAGFGGSDSSQSTSTTVRKAKTSTVTSVADISDQPIIVAPADRYSSFQSKDPFVQQQVPSTTSVTTPKTTNPPTSTTTTTTATTSTSTTSTTTTSSTGSTSSSTTSTTSFYTHMLQVLSVRDVGGAPAVTFQVDNNVYVDQRVGDTVSTSWGDVKVVSIDTDAKVVSLLHANKTLTLTERQILFE